jgi:hypothetical protein
MDDACGPHRSFGHGRLDQAPVDGQDFGGRPQDLGDITALIRLLGQQNQS